MSSVLPTRLVLPILLIAGMVLHVSLPGLGCGVVASGASGVAGGFGDSGDSGGCQMAAQSCRRSAEAKRCCRAMERAVEMTSCCMAKMPCGGPKTPPPCEDSPDPPCDDCTMGRCPVMRWMVLHEKSHIDDAAAFQMRRIDLAAMLPVDWVACDAPPPEPPGTAAGLAQRCTWLI